MEEKEINEIAPTEEVKEEVTEVEEKEIVVDSNYVEPILVKDDKEVEVEVNKARNNFQEIYKSTTKLNRLIAGAFLILVIAGAVVTYALPKYVIYLFIAIIVTFVVVLIYTKSARKKMDAAVRAYLDTYSAYTESYSLSNDKITELKLGYKEKIDEAAIQKMEFVNDICQISSRNMVKGKMSGKYFELADVSIKTGNIKDRKSQKAVFVGKVYCFEYKNNDFGRTICYLKGCGDASPTKLEDVNEVSIDSLSKDWKIYTSSNGYNKLFTSEVIKALNEIKTDELLNDIIITFQKDMVYVGFSYSDELMVIPMYTEYSVSPLNHYKNDVNLIIKLNEAFMKNSYLK